MEWQSENMVRHHLLLVEFVPFLWDYFTFHTFAFDTFIIDLFFPPFFLCGSIFFPYIYYFLQLQWPDLPTGIIKVHLLNSLSKPGRLIWFRERDSHQQTFASSNLEKHPSERENIHRLTQLWLKEGWRVNLTCLIACKGVAGNWTAAQ